MLHAPQPVARAAQIARDLTAHRTAVEFREQWAKLCHSAKTRMHHGEFASCAIGKCGRDFTSGGLSRFPNVLPVLDGPGVTADVVIFASQLRLQGERPGVFRVKLEKSSET